jgi:hypothetical protein
MAVRSSDIPALLVERIEAAHPEPALFSRTETDGWPQGALDHLVDRGFLRLAHRAESVVCPGCEWQCHKAVVVRKAKGSPEPLALIDCDEAPDHGHVFIPLRSLH